MSRYFYKPYVPVAERRAKAARQAREAAKKGEAYEPVGELNHRTKIATSFWGHGWCRHLESFSDFDNRLPRGRTYVRNGSVIDLKIQPGEVQAKVMGSELYQLSVTIDKLPAKRWKAVKSRCQGGIGSLIELLQGRFSDEIMKVVTDPGEGLFPRPGEMRFRCDCPDWAGMCKHIAAALYGIGARLDQSPELLFRLRGVDHAELIAMDAATDRLASGSSSRRRRTLDAAAIGDVFGLGEEDDDAPVPPAARSGGKASAARRSKKPKGVAEAAPSAPAFGGRGVDLRRLAGRLPLSHDAFARLLGFSPDELRARQARSGKLRFDAGTRRLLDRLAAEFL
jgi:uncharacterized Zn finger protein